MTASLLLGLLAGGLAAACSWAAIALLQWWTGPPSIGATALRLGLIPAPDGTPSRWVGRHEQFLVTLELSPEGVAEVRVRGVPPELVFDSLDAQDQTDGPEVGEQVQLVATIGHVRIASGVLQARAELHRPAAPHVRRLVHAALQTAGTLCDREDDSRIDALVDRVRSLRDSGARRLALTTLLARHPGEAAHEALAAAAADPDIGIRLLAAQHLGDADALSRLVFHPEVTLAQQTPAVAHLLTHGRLALDTTIRELLRAGPDDARIRVLRGVDEHELDGHGPAILDIATQVRARPDTSVHVPLRFRLAEALQRVEDPDAEALLLELARSDHEAVWQRALLALRRCGTAGSRQGLEQLAGLEEDDRRGPARSALAAIELRTVAREAGSALGLAVEGECELWGSVGGRQTRITLAPEMVMVEVEGVPPGLGLGPRLHRGAEIGDPEFDPRFVVSGDAATSAVVLGLAVRTQLVRVARSGYRVHVASGVLRLHVSKRPRLDAVLDPVQVASQLAGALCDALGGPGALAAHLDTEPHPRVRAWQLRMLLLHHPAPAVAEGVARALSDPDPEVRLVAGRHARNVDTLCDVISEEAAIPLRLRRQALEAMVTISRAALLRGVEAALAGPEAPGLAEAVGEAVVQARLGEATEAILTFLRRSHGSGTGILLPALADVGDHRALGQLEEALAVEHAPTQRHAIRGLARIGTVSAVPALRRLAGRRLAMTALSREARQAIKAIQERVRNAEPGGLTVAELGSRGELSEAPLDGGVSVVGEPE